MKKFFKGFLFYIVIGILFAVTFAAFRTTNWSSYEMLANRFLFTDGGTITGTKYLDTNSGGNIIAYNPIINASGYNFVTTAYTGFFSGASESDPIWAAASGNYMKLSGTQTVTGITIISELFDGNPYQSMTSGGNAYVRLGRLTAGKNPNIITGVAGLQIQLNGNAAAAISIQGMVSFGLSGAEAAGVRGDALQINTGVYGIGVKGLLWSLTNLGTARGVAIYGHEYLGSANKTVANTNVGYFLREDFFTVGSGSNGAILKVNNLSPASVGDLLQVQTNNATKFKIDSTGDTYIYSGLYVPNMPIDGSYPEVTVDSSGKIYKDELAGGYAYWLTGNTVTATGGVWVSFAGTFQNDVLDNFHFSGDKIVYDGNTKKFIINRQASLSFSTSDSVVSLGIFKNGTLCTGSKSSIRLANTNDVNFVSTMDQDSLSSGDTIQLVISANKAGTFAPISAQASIIKFY